MYLHGPFGTAKGRSPQNSKFEVTAGVSPGNLMAVAGKVWYFGDNISEGPFLRMLTPWSGAVSP